MAGRKLYNMSDLERKTKKTRTWLVRYLPKIRAPKDVMGYYNWNKSEFDGIVRELRNADPRGK
jgi:hypothetical protein